MKPSTNTILFLCTGNYYRSRFAEMYFNHLVAEAGLPWTAESRGLAIERGVHLVGPISPATVAELNALGVVLPADHRGMLQCSSDDLHSASRVIAIKEAEHRPLLCERFAGWENRVTYWHVHDLDGSTTAEALGELRHLVQVLVTELSRDFHLNRARAAVL